MNTNEIRQTFKVVSAALMIRVACFAAQIFRFLSHLSEACYKTRFPLK